MFAHRMNGAGYEQATTGHKAAHVDTRCSCIASHRGSLATTCASTCRVGSLKVSHTLCTAGRACKSVQLQRGLIASNLSRLLRNCDVRGWTKDL